MHLYLVSYSRSGVVVERSCRMRDNGVRSTVGADLSQTLGRCIVKLPPVDGINNVQLFIFLGWVGGWGMALKAILNED